jgi:hypothetical protein
MIDHKYIQQGDNKMKLSKVASDLEQRLTKRNNAETAKQKAAYVRSAQAWYQLQKAQSEEMKARQRFIQAAVAYSSSRGQP